MENNNSSKITTIEPIITSLDKMGEKDLTLQILDAFHKRSINFKEYDELAKCYFKIRHYEKAIQLTEKALVVASTSQEMYTTRFNLINVYNHANYPEKALQYIKHCKYVIPNDIDIFLEEAYSLFLLNRKSEAEAILHKVLLTYDDQLTDEYRTKIKFNLGTYYLLRDKFQEGMKLFLEEGAKMKFWNTESIFARNFNLNFENFELKLKAGKYKLWDGIPRPGSPIIVHAEAGIGDEIINFRFMQNLVELGMDAYWYNSFPERSDILAVFKRQGFNVIKSLKEINHDGDIYYAQSMHLPITLKLQYPDLWKGPYITADAEFVEKHKETVKPSSKLKIGLRWQGNPMYDHDLHRSVNLDGYYEALKHLDADFYSLQKDNGLDELAGFPSIVDLSDKMNSWEDTLAIIENLDIVMTSCTSVAHASASMGKKTFVFVPISAYYVWSHSMEQSPWYGDNVVLFRQERPRTWEEPLAKLKGYL